MHIILFIIGVGLGLGLGFYAGITAKETAKEEKARKEMLRYCAPLFESARIYAKGA